MTDVTMPQLGETVTEGTIIKWFKSPGDAVALDEVLFEVSTDKIDSEVPSPVAGFVVEILAEVGEIVKVGQVLCRVGDSLVEQTEPFESDRSQQGVETDNLRVAPQGARVMPGPMKGAGSLLPPPPARPRPSPDPVSLTAPQPKVAADSRSVQSTERTAAPLLSPLVRRLIADNQLDVATIAGTGVGGRVTRADVEAAIRARRLATVEATHGPVASDKPPPAAALAADLSTGDPPISTAPASQAVSEPIASTPAAPAGSAGTTESALPTHRTLAMPAPRLGTRDQIVALSNIRRRTADHMVMSKAASPHVLTAMEIDYERVEQVRRSERDAWKTQEGFSLTYLPFIARAVTDALREFPHLNASFGGDHLLVHNDVNLAIAIDIDFEGLLAPVVKGVDGKRLRRIARDIVDLAARARTGQLTPDDLTGGTFTITNAGSYGTLMQFPIINQPQVAILSTDGVKRKPVVVTDEFGNESIAIHSIGVLALAWDHRAFDGAYAAAFLNKVQTIIETRDWTAELG